MPRSPVPLNAGPTRARLPLERMLRIHRAIQAGNYPTATALAAEIEVARKTGPIDDVAAHLLG